MKMLDQRGDVVKLCWRVLFVATCVGLVASVISIFISFWVTELVISFLPLGLVLSTLSLALFWGMRLSGRARPIKKLRLLMASFLWFVLIVWMSGQFTHGPAAAQDGSETALRLYSHNILYKQDNAQAVLANVASVKADVVALMEAYDYDFNTIKKGMGYEYQHITACGCSAPGTEIGILSAHPVLDSRTVQLTSQPRGVAVLARIRPANKPVMTVVAVHMPVPYEPGEYELRKEAYKTLTQELNKISGPLVLMGDFNTTVWSADLRDFDVEMNGKLDNVSSGRWPTPSWCSAKVSWACLRIDHLYVSPQVSFHDFTIGNDAKSDHKPLIVDIDY